MKRAAEDLIEGRDFYFDDDGRMVFTVLYLRERGTCCGSGCRHCPYRPEENEPAPPLISAP